MAVLDQYKGLVNNIGKAGANSIFPKEIEYYFMAFELIDSLDRVVDYFALPVLPSSFKRSEASLMNIKNTNRGISVTDTSKFVSINFNISGNFGKRLKLLLGTQNVNFNVISFSSSQGVFSKDQIGQQVNRFSVFNTSVKTGYGCTKLIQSIFDKSRALDESGNPYKLIFYNPTFGESHIVKLKDFSFSQNEQNNMIWQYDINFTAIAPLKSVTLKSVVRLGLQNLNEGINQIVNDLRVAI